MTEHNLDIGTCLSSLFVHGLAGFVCMYIFVLLDRF